MNNKFHLGVRFIHNKFSGKFSSKLERLGIQIHDNTLFEDIKISMVG
jgi:hypothetical protein